MLRRPIRQIAVEPRRQPMPGMVVFAGDMTDALVRAAGPFIG
jgi:hypothetical protein